MRRFKHRFRWLLPTMLVASLAACTPERDPLVEASALPVIAVFPFANLTESGTALADIMPELVEEIGRRGIPCISDEDMRPILRRNRIRGGGVLSAQDFSSIREETGAQMLLMGSINFYSEGAVPELGLSLRLIDIESLEVLYARSVARTGADWTGLFGIGKRVHISELRAPVLEEIFADLDIQSLRMQLSSDALRAAPAIAVLPFEGDHEYPFSKYIFTQILLSELYKAGYRVIDPSRLGDFYLRFRRAPGVGIDREMAGRMREELGLDWIVTGSLENFQPAMGEQGSAPELEWDARLINARTGRIVSAYREERRGSPPNQVFGFEERRSLGRLAAKSAKKLVGDIQNSIEDSFE